MTLIDNAVYVNGHRTADPRSLEETYEVLRDRDGLAWIGPYRPAAEIRSVVTEFEWHACPCGRDFGGAQRPSWSVRSDPVRGAAPGAVSP